MRITPKAILLYVCKTLTVISKMIQEMGIVSVSKPHIHVLIAAAGSGSRLSNSENLPKQYLNLNGKTILERSILKFKNTNKIKSISCIINLNYKDKYKAATHHLNIEPAIEGSSERNKSIYNGLKSLVNVKNEEILLIHDAARPLIAEKDILKLIKTLETERAATLATPINATLRKANNDDCGEHIPRDNLWAMQTPQAFRYGDILMAHETADKNTAHTDDTSIATAAGIDVKIVEGSSENFKITTKDDFLMAEKLLNAQTQTRTGLGYDVHAFDTDDTGPIRIGGIDIEHPRTLKGHSDADVALHAIADAILGAIGEGDIGRHFPPSDNTFKDMDSAIFLEKTMDLLKKHNASINNIDLTIICEEPKISPHAAQMRTRIASILNLNETAINIKATTSEQLGFTGRKEGIAAQAIATVSIHA